MRNKILWRLISYFATSFAIFALISGLMFTILFSQRNVETHRAELTRRAVNIARSLSEMADAGDGALCMCEIENYVSLIESVFSSEIWVVDMHRGQVIFGCRTVWAHTITMPARADYIIENAFMGHTTLCDMSFSMYFDTPSVTVATPLVLQDGSILGVILVHIQVESDELTKTGILLLGYSMIAAVGGAVGVAVLLSSRFTRPLGKMKAAALKISGGDYTGRTGVAQQDEIGELAAIMDTMAEKLAFSAEESRRFERLRQDFVANISHELRTPITVIRGSLEALCDGVITEPEKVQEYHGQMLSECKYLGRLVSDLLDLSRLQNAAFAMEMRDVNLRDVLEDTLTSMAGLAARKDIELALACDGEEFMLLGDYSRLRQMIIILLDNAIKFSPAGSQVDIALTQKNTLACVSVTDQGTGISPADMEHIFERFHKQRSEHNKSGTGLGLAIAKEIAARHGASLKAENGAAGGAKFTFTVPLAQ